MRMNRMRIPVFLLAFCLSAPGQHIGPKASRLASNFAIDPAKPYVYLELDHVGPRQPRGRDEPSVGIYLRLRNNSKLSIVVSTFGSPPGSSECVMDEVVRNPKVEGAVTGGGSIADSIAPAKPAGGEEEPPLGYIFDLRTATPIAPGGQLSFSVPINHVGPKWHFEIPFRFDLPRTHQRQPQTYVTFFYEDLPPKD